RGVSAGRHLRGAYAGVRSQGVRGAAEHGDDGRDAGAHGAMTCQLVLAERAIVDAGESVSAHTDLAGTPHAAPLSRLFLREHLRGRVSADVLHTAELLTTELVA